MNTVYLYWDSGCTSPLKIHTYHARCKHYYKLCLSGQIHADDLKELCIISKGEAAEMDVMLKTNKDRPDELIKFEFITRMLHSNCMSAQLDNTESCF